MSKSPFLYQSHFAVRGHHLQTFLLRGYSVNTAITLTEIQLEKNLFFLSDSLHLHTHVHLCTHMCIDVLCIIKRKREGEKKEELNLAALFTFTFFFFFLVFAFAAFV